MFDQTYRIMSEMIHDRATVTMEANRNSYAIYRMVLMTLSDIEWFVKKQWGRFTLKGRNPRPAGRRAWVVFLGGFLAARSPSFTSKGPGDAVRPPNSSRPPTAFGFLVLGNTYKRMLYYRFITKADPQTKSITMVRGSSTTRGGVNPNTRQMEHCFSDLAIYSMTRSIARFLGDMQLSFSHMNKQIAQLSQRDRATHRVIEYFANSLKIIRNDNVE